MPRSPNAFAAYSLLNSWRQFGGDPYGLGYGPVTVWKSPSGEVGFTGLVDKAGGNWLSGETIVQLPPGFLPVVADGTGFTPSFLCYAIGNGVPGAAEVRVSPSGSVYVQYTALASPVNLLSLGGMRFLASA